MMKPIINITEKNLFIVLQILKKHLPQDTAVWVFGSRAENTAKQFSDLDIAIDAKAALPYSTLVDLKIEFEESDLPYKVDLVDWHLIDDSFRKRIAPYKHQTQLDLRAC